MLELAKYISKRNLNFDVQEESEIEDYAAWEGLMCDWVRWQKKHGAFGFSESFFGPSDQLFVVKIRCENAYLFFCF